jgi:hypothetical protein
MGRGLIYGVNSYFFLFICVVVILFYAIICTYHFASFEVQISGAHSKLLDLFWNLGCVHFCVAFMVPNWFGFGVHLSLHVLQWRRNGWRDEQDGNVLLKQTASIIRLSLLKQTTSIVNLLTSIFFTFSLQNLLDWIF